MKSFQQLAQIAYETHAKQAYKTNGTVAFPWKLLTPLEQECWVKTMQAVVAELESIH